MERESTLGDIYEAIADNLAEARTRALMGERQEALGVFQGAALEFTRFQNVLRDYPGFLALNHAFETTLIAMQAEQEAVIIRAVEPVAAEKPRRVKIKKAA